MILALRFAEPLTLACIASGVILKTLYGRASTGMLVLVADLNFCVGFSLRSSRLLSMRGISCRLFLCIPVSVHTYDVMHPSTPGISFFVDGHVSILLHSDTLC